jgi:hypothetical protein
MIAKLRLHLKQLVDLLRIEHRGQFTQVAAFELGQTHMFLTDSKARSCCRFLSDCITGLLSWKKPRRNSIIFAS